MNERIKELAEQADAYADAMDIGGKNYIGLRDKYFAELIVKECIDRVRLQPQMDEVEAWVYRDLELDIKKHFGFEE
jgi:hypothetical protein